MSFARNSLALAASAIVLLGVVFGPAGSTPLAHAGSGNALVRSAPLADSSAGDTAASSRQLERRVDTDFSSMPTGPFDYAGARAAFETHGASVQQGGSQGSLQIVSDPDGPGRVLRAFYPKNEVGSAYLFFVNLAEGSRAPYGWKEGEMSMRIRFGSGFEMDALGVKLPGLAARPTVDSPVVSGGRDVEGMSARTTQMGTSNPHNKSGDSRFGQYLYHMNRDASAQKGQKFGEQFAYQGPGLVSDRWYEVRSRIVMNDPGKANGVAQSWVDGKKVLHETGLEFRSHDGYGVNVLFMHSMVGGNTDDWAHSRDEVIYVDDFKVHVGQ